MKSCMLASELDKAATIEQMNELGKKHTPFLFIISYNCAQNFVLQPKEAKKAGIRYMFCRKELMPDITKGFFYKNPIDFATYKKSFDLVYSNLHFGNSYLTNLTFSTPIATSFSLNDIYEHANSPFKLIVPGMFTVFSPEMFIRIQNHTITSSPMKGTIDASCRDAKNQLLGSEKELAEHITIVDLLRNDLSMVAKNVYVSNFRYITKVHGNDKDLLQASSDINGTLPHDFYHNLGTIVFNLLPAGSVTGAPKEKTLDIIEQAENYKRGFYTGIFGFFDGQNLISAVSIRFIELINGKMYFKSGGGITIDSNPKTEYNEMVDKVYLPFRYM